ILQSEGGYEVDQGGPTNLSVTLAMWSSWTRRPATAADIQGLTVPLVTPFSLGEFWNPCHLPLVPAGLDLMVFDEGVNEGQGRAIRHLQQALGVPADGLFGPRTALALSGLSDVVGAINRIHGDNAAYYQA